MRVIMGYLPGIEQLWTQVICKWFYNIGTSRVQWRIRIPSVHLFTHSTARDKSLKNKIVSITTTGKVNLIEPVYQDMDISHINWQSVTIDSFELFQLKNDSKECRKLMVKFDYSDYRVRGRQDADSKRSGPALVRVYNHVLAISGKNLLTVSSHDINTNKWDGNLSNVN